MEVTHEEDLALLLEHQGEARLKIMRLTIILTIRTIAPDHSVEDAFKKVVRILADQLRQRAN